MRAFPIEWRGPGKLAVVSRPSPEDLARDCVSFRHSGYDTLVSLLSGAEAVELGLADERQAAEQAGLTFHSLPVLDFSVPESQSFRAALFGLHDHFRSGGAIGAHCRGSVGRSPLLIASILVLDGAAPDDAWLRVSNARGVPVPDTDAQRTWIATLSSRV